MKLGIVRVSFVDRDRPEDEQGDLEIDTAGSIS
jgi:hypothetical protein